MLHSSNTPQPGDRHDAPQYQGGGSRINFKLLAVIIVTVCVLQLMYGKLIVLSGLIGLVLLFIAFPRIPELLAIPLVGRSGYNPIFRWANRIARIGCVYAYAYARNVDYRGIAASLRRRIGQ